MSTKSSQIQLRVSPPQKAALQRLAREAGLSVSAYLLSRALPPARLRFDELVRALARQEERRFALAEINDLLAGLAPIELAEAVGGAEPGGLSPYLQNYLAAMVELAAQRQGVAPPAWTGAVEPLAEPSFATDLPGLRLHLLRSAPVAFKRRNLFVDASIGDRV
jgi:uncharacterized protein (DUF1778 family)